MPARLSLLLAALLLCACAGPLARQPATRGAPLQTAAVARPTRPAELLPTANPAVIDQPILDDLAGVRCH